MNSQQLMHFKNKMMNDFFKINYEHFTMDTTTPEPNDTDIDVDVSLIDVETTETNDTDPQVEVESVSESLTPLISTEVDDDISYINTRRHGNGRYLS
jgi:hypothetical protein